MQKSEIFLDEKKNSDFRCKNPRFCFGQKNSDFQCKNPRFFLDEKNTRIFSAKIRDFFWTRKKSRIFSAEIRDFFRPKKVSDFCTENPSFFFFFLKKILCLSCISHGRKRRDTSTWNLVAPGYGILTLNCAGVCLPPEKQAPGIMCKPRAYKVIAGIW